MDDLVLIDTRALVVELEDIRHEIAEQGGRRSRGKGQRHHRAVEAVGAYGDKHCGHTLIR